jgi:hypothetical protein
LRHHGSPQLGERAGIVRFLGAIHGLLIWFIDTSADRRAGAQQGRAQ